MTRGLGAMSGAPFGWLEALTVEVDSGVLVVTMNRPERLNAYDRTMVEQRRAAVLVDPGRVYSNG